MEKGNGIPSVRLKLGRTCEQGYFRSRSITDAVRVGWVSRVTRSLFSDESANLKGHLEMFADIFDAAEVDRRPKLYRPIPITKPRQENLELRVVIYTIRDCCLPNELANNDPSKLAAFYAGARFGNRSEDVSKNRANYKHVSDGSAEFNCCMKWVLKLASLDVKPRLKLSIFDNTSLGMGGEQLCTVADIKLRSLFNEIVRTRLQY